MGNYYIHNGNTMFVPGCVGVVAFCSTAADGLNHKPDKCELTELGSNLRKISRLRKNVGKSPTYEKLMMCMRFTKNLRKTYQKLTKNSRKTYDSNLTVVKSILCCFHWWITSPFSVNINNRNYINNCDTSCGNWVYWSIIITSLIIFHMRVVCKPRT